MAASCYGWGFLAAGTGRLIRAKGRMSSAKYRRKALTFPEGPNQNPDLNPTEHL